MRNKIRFYWLTFLRDLRRFFTLCQRCKRYGASPCSVAAGINLCDHCQREECIKLSRRIIVARKQSIQLEAQDGM